jgi:hypothetical protein
MLWRDVSLAACQKARIYFTSELAESMDFDPKVHRRGRTPGKISHREGSSLSPQLLSLE